MSNMIPFRLRVGKDEDLEAAFESLPSYIDRSNVIREALRSYFFGSTTPIRDNVGMLELSLSAPKAPREVKVVKELSTPKIQPKLAIDFNSVVSNPVDDSELESKLNKSLGF